MSVQTEQSRRGGRTAAAVVAVTALVATVVLAEFMTRPRGGAAVDPASGLTTQQLQAAAEKRVYFGHQSVGANVLDGVPAVFAEGGVTAPAITDDLASAPSGGVLAHAYIGENTQPAGKIVAFDAALRGGVADQVDVALMKLCWVDFNGETDVDALFASYQRTLAALERDFPEVTFLHVTTPLTAQSSGAKHWVKNLLGKPDYNAADNVVRERYNALMRAEYASTGRLFDLAAMESTAPDGSRVTGTYEGATYYALAPEWASDPGHLNAAGSQVAAGQLLGLIASTS